MLAACGGSSNSSTGTLAVQAVTPPTSSVALTASQYTVSQSAGSVAVTVSRTGSSADAISVAFSTSDDTAMAGTDYTASSGTLQWAENDSTPKTISVPVSNLTPFTGQKQFNVALTDPSSSTTIGSPGSAVVMIAGDATPAQQAVAFADATYNVGQAAGSITVSVNRSGGSSGAASVGYVTADGSAVAGKDYTTTTGTLQWADGDAAAKTFSIPISAATAFTGNKNFTVSLTNASGAAIGSPSSATVTIAGSGSPPVGSLQLSASSFAVAQNAGSVVINVTRLGGSSGAVSVAYATANGTAAAGTNYTAASGTLNWASGDTASKKITVAISNATPFTGNKTFTVALSNPSGGATIASPGSATVSIAGDAVTTGNVQLSASSYSVAQTAGSLTVSVSRTGGSSGAIGVSYATANGTAVSGTDYTQATGTLQWASGDATAKTISIPIGNATAFSGTKSFTITLSAPTGGAAVGSPSSATVSITGNAAAAVGSVQLSASGYSVAQSGGSLSLTVNRTGGSSGAISVAYATTDGTAIAGTDYTAENGTLNWASGDAASKTISIPVSNATPYTGSKTLTVALSSPAGGATLSTPNSATVTITGSQAAPAGSTLWVYYNGVFNWGGDWSFALGSLTYSDVLGGPIEGPFDISITSQQWGGWQPFVSANCQSNISQCFNTLPYKYLIFSAKPTVANQVFDVGFMSSGDTADGATIFDTSPYCSGGSNPATGQWESCKIPLSVFKLTDTTILKFWISDQTGLGSNHWYLDNVGFSVN